MKKGFTLMELLVVVALLILIAIVVLVALNPWAQIAKSQDSKRKAELTQLNKVLEDWYNDKGCYPRPDQICYGEITNVCNANRVKTQTCYICGNESTSPSFSPYLSRLPCDPQHGTKKYFYQTEASEANLLCSTLPKDAQKNCPSWYRIYSDFSAVEDKESANLGCYSGGCGVAPVYGYDYGVSSPNKSLEVSNKYTFDAGDGTCQTCGTYECCHDTGCAPNAIGRPLYGSCQSCCDVVHCGNPCPQ